jgi:hypothetical protein
MALRARRRSTLGIGRGWILLGPRSTDPWGATTTARCPSLVSRFFRDKHVEAGLAGERMIVKRCNEGGPRSVIEAYAAGVPVIGRL